MNTQEFNVVNSKAGRTTEVKTGRRNNISVLDALEAKYNLPITAYDWLEPTVQVLDSCLSTIPYDYDGETTIMTLKMIPINYCGSTRLFYSEWFPEKHVTLEDCIYDENDEYKRIDLSLLAALLKEMVDD